MTDRANAAMKARRAASGVVSLPEATIRRVRVGVMAATGLGAVGLGVTRLTEAVVDPSSWLYANGIAYMAAATGCLMAVLLTLTPFVRTSEVVTLMTAYLSTVGVIITETPEFAPVMGMAAFSLVVLLPGVVVQVRSTHAGTVNVVAVCAGYLVSMLICLVVRTDSGITEGRDLAFKLVVPTLALAVAWFMAHALNSRVLEALADSEGARGDLRRAFDREVAFNEALIRFVPREFLTSLGREDISEVQLGDSVTRTMSVLFADICDYTRLVEGLPPGSTAPLLNELFGALGPATAPEAARMLKGQSRRGGSGLRSNTVLRLRADD